MTEPIGVRVKEIRDARGEKQPEFAAAMNHAAQRLRIAKRYDSTMVSKMEVGRRDVTLTDVLVIATLDKAGRGREWLAWGNSPDATKLPQPGEEAEDTRATHQKPKVARRPA